MTVAHTRALARAFRNRAQKLIAVWTGLEPIPLVVSNPVPIATGLMRFGIGHAFLYRWLSPAWPRGIMARAWRMGGLIFFLSFLFWEFFTPFNQLGEPILLIGVELIFWVTIAIAEAFTIATAFDWRSTPEQERGLPLTSRTAVGYKLGMELCRYLFERFKEAGVGHVFGLPGDFFLPFFRALEEEPGIEPVILTHEPGVGYAADAYARIRGLGVAAVTYGAGALNMVNAIAQAYAERSPVLVLSGAPEIAHRDPDALLHHRVKTFASQLRVYREVTGAAAALDDPAHAIAEVDRVIESVLRTKRPGYIEIPRDLVRADVPVPARRPREVKLRDARAANEALAEVLARLRVAEQPAIYAGADIRRFRLHDKLVALAEKYGLPVATSLDGKAVFPERHPLFVGNYLGEIGSPRARQVLETADCVLMLGALMTDVNTGLYTARFDRRKVISALQDGTTVSYHRFPDVTLEELMDALLAQPEPPRRTAPLPPPLPREPAPAGGLTPDAIIAVLNRVAADRPVLYTADVGDALFASVELETDMFLGPGYYSSMGFAVPAAVGAGLAEPGRRPVALVGDGAFLMTGLDLVTCVRLELHAIVILFNNHSHGMLAAIDGPARSYDLPAPDYVRLAESLGARACRARTSEELERTLAEALGIKATILIDAVIPPGAYSAPMQRLGAIVRRLVRK